MASSSSPSGVHLQAGASLTAGADARLANRPRPFARCRGRPSSRQRKPRLRDLGCPHRKHVDQISVNLRAGARGSRLTRIADFEPSTPSSARRVNRLRVVEATYGDPSRCPTDATVERRQREGDRVLPRVVVAVRRCRGQRRSSRRRSPKHARRCPPRRGRASSR